ncbi:chromosome segregation protein SMC, partial [Candidatus Desantisbacteria bacterium]|nr:chromosome segregation protein SMC [Candidatus Desantisbacteria bacterium]
MQLKRVEIYGFKTFADKTELLFSPGMTAIVGPNGCGKTNILDAIRWVLGEQSTKVLRSNKMDEVIYNGGQNRKPLGMAEVSLTLINNKKVLPVEYDEVTITRRLYRSGESEYYINQSECRLKDINELFMDTGMGSHVYSIIEQSQIDLILSNNPSLRRMLFEEAAGIMKYKTRKKETMNKLEQTGQNLLRVNDIIQEVSRQSDILKSQAGRAKKYLEYRDEFKELEKRLILQEYIDFDQISKTSGAALTELDEKKSGIQAETLNLESKMDAYKVEIIGIDRKITEEHETQFKVDMELDKLESVIAFDRERLGNLEVQKTKEIENKALYEDKQNENQKKLSEIKSEIEKNNIEIGQYKEKLETAQTALFELKNQLTTKENDIEKYKNDEYEIKKQIASREAILSTHESKTQEISDKRKTVENEKQELLQSKKMQEEKIYQLRQEIDNLEKEKTDNNNNIISKSKELERLKHELNEKKDLLYSKSELKTEKQSRLNTLKNLKESMSGYFTGVKEIFLEKKSGNLKGCLGVVADFMRTSSKYERALEVALGSNIQNIVTETAQDAKQAIEYLKSKNKGWGTFLPLDLISSQNNNDTESNIKNHEGVLGFALDLIEFDQKYLSIMKYLLNKVVIVRTLDDAIEIVKKGAGRSYKLVTLDGEMTNSAGAITGGSLDKRTTGLLGREREIEELTKDVRILDEEFKNELGIVENVKNRISILEPEIQELQKTYRLKEFSLIEKNNLKIRIQDEQELIIRRLTESENILTAIDTENENSLQLKIVSEKDLFELQSRLMEITQKTKQYSEIKDQDKKEHDELQNKLTDIKINLASKQEKFLHIENTEKNIIKSTEELAVAINRCMENLNKISQDRINLENDIKEKEKLIFDLFEKKKNQSKEVFAIEEKHKELQEIIRNVEDELKIKKKDFDKIQQEWYELEVKNKEIHLKLSAITEKLRTDFSINAEDLKTIEIQEELDREVLKEKIELLRTRMIKMEPVNVMAIEEYKEVSERQEFLLTQRKDLEEAHDSLLKTIDKINRTSEKNFKETFELIKNNFIYVFKKFFQGGTADIILVEGPENIDPGIEIIAQPPGKKPQTITLLSGGERALTAIALIFGIFMVKPSPFCILDEVDAPLDDNNINK